MYELETTIDMVAQCLPADFVRWYNGQTPYDPPLGPTDECSDILVTVEYRPGWYVPAKISGPPEDCYPAEGMDPEIISVTIAEPDYKGPTTIEERSIPQDLYDKLVKECWEDQRELDEDPGWDPDLDDDGDDYRYNDPRLDYLNF